MRGIAIASLLAGSIVIAGAAQTTVQPQGPTEEQINLSEIDPGSYATSLLIIIVSCVLAAIVPALRAARIDPIATLRQE